MGCKLAGASGAWGLPQTMCSPLASCQGDAVQTISGSPLLLLGPGQGLGFARCPERGWPSWRLSWQPQDETAKPR